MPVPVAPHKPLKWVLTQDHGFHALSRAQEVWRYRYLFKFFASQAFRSLYKGTQLGIIWVPLRPLTPLIIGTLVYGGLMAIPSGGVPYFLLLTGASIAWNCFDDPWMWGNRGLELNRDIVSKLYFPRMLLPFSTMMTGFVVPVVNVAVFLAALVYYWRADGVWYVPVAPSLLWLPVVAAVIVLFAFSLALMTSLYQVRAREVRFVIGYALGFWMYLTPVIYPITLVPEEHRWLMWLNPLAPLVEAFKASLFGWDWPPAWALTLSTVEAFVLFAAGFWHFHVMEGATADKI